MEARNWVCSFSTFCTDFAIPIAKATIVNVFLTYYYRTLGKSLLWYFSLMVFCPWCTVGSMLVNVQAWIVRCPIFHSTEQRMLTTWWTCAIFCPNVQLILRKRKKKLVVSVGSHPNIGSLSGSSVAKHLRAMFRLLSPPHRLVLQIWPGLGLVLAHVTFQTGCDSPQLLPRHEQNLTLLRQT